MQNKTNSSLLLKSLSKNLNTSTCMTAIAASIILTAGTAVALPKGATVAHGDVSLKQSGKNLTVNQRSDKAVINWKGFDIAKDEATHFQQPNSNSIALNRVTDSTAPSKVFGTLSATGRLVLVNPNGVFFDESSRVNVGGMIATSADISDKNFIDGKLDFDKAGAANAKITNKGTITAKEGGLVSLVAPSVENSGIIRAKAGTVALGSGETVSFDFYGDELVNFAVKGEAAEGINNSGQLSAVDGDVYLTADAASKVVDEVINTSGVIEATSLTKQGNVVILGGEGDVKVSGKIDVSSKKAGQKGGNVKVSGKNVKLSKAKVNASGDVKGGTIEVGGGKRGESTYETANTVVVDKNSSLVADGVSGDGGDVTLWSEKATHFTGDISTKGSVNGGFAEVSSRGLLGFYGAVDLKGVNGEGGTLLLDPENVTITSTAPGADDAELADGVILEADGGSSDFEISASAVEAALAFGDVVIEALNTINVQAAIDVANDAAALGNDLTLQADRLLLRADISLNNADLNLLGNEIGIRSAINLGEGVLTALGMDGISASTLFETSTGSSIDSTLASGTAIDINADDVNLKGSITTIGNVEVASDTTRVSGSVYTDQGSISIEADDSIVITDTGSLASEDPTAASILGVSLDATDVEVEGDILTRGNIIIDASNDVNIADTATLESRFKNIEITATNDVNVEGIVDSGNGSNPDFTLITAGNKVTVAEGGVVDGSGFAKLVGDVVEVAGTLTSINNIVIQANAKTILSGLLSGTILDSAAGGDPMLTSTSPVVDVDSNTIGINQGIAIANEGGTVNLAGIVFTQGDIEIDKQLTLQGKSKSQTRIDSAGFDNGIILRDGSDESNIVDLTVRNADQDGILVDAPGAVVDKILLEDVASVNNGGSGLLVTDGTTLNKSTVVGACFNENADDGFKVAAGGVVDFFRIRNSEFDRNSGSGFHVESTGTGTSAKSGTASHVYTDDFAGVRTSFSNNSRHGIFLTSARDFRVTGADINSNGITGVALKNNDDTPGILSDVSIKDSNILDNQGFGFFAEVLSPKSVNSLEVVGNTFKGNGEVLSVSDNITFKAGDGTLNDMNTNSGAVIDNLIGDNNLDLFTISKLANGDWQRATSGSFHIYSTIAEGVACANEGSTMYIGDGVYDEVINTSGKDFNITSYSGNADDVVLAPTTLAGLGSFTESFGNNWISRPVISVLNSTVDISNITIDASGLEGLLGLGERAVGIGYKLASGNIDNVTISDVFTGGSLGENRFFSAAADFDTVSFNDVNGRPEGVGILVDNHVTSTQAPDGGVADIVTITNNDISNYGETGILAHGSDTTVTISNNNVDADGVSDVSRRGIALTGDVAGTVASNDVFNVTSDGSIGIHVEDVANGFTVTNNVVTGANVTTDGTGIGINDDVLVSGNDVSGFEHGIYANDGNSTVVGGTLTDNTTGLRIDRDGEVTITDLVTNGGDNGIIVDGVDAQINYDDVNGSSFSGYASKAIAYLNNAMFGQSDDGRNFFFNGVKAGDLAEPEIEVTDVNDDSTLGDIFFSVASNTPTAPTTPEVPDTTPEVPDTTPEVPDTTPEVPETTPEVPTTTPEVPTVTPAAPAPATNLALSQPLEEFTGFQPAAGEGNLSFFGQTLANGESFNGDLNLNLQGQANNVTGTTDLDPAALGELAPAAGGQNATEESNCGNNYLQQGYSTNFREDECETERQNLTVGSNTNF